jgi:hypothetical protein
MWITPLPPSLSALGEGSHGSILNGNYAPNRLSSAWKPTLLFFERSGFVLVLKALSEDRFRWPRREAPVVTLDTEQLRWLLDGIDLDAMVRHPVRQYEFVG